ncbi:MAG: flagellar hook-basal body complex protein [Planctomycetota bacterium]
MSLGRAMSSAVSALQAHQVRIDTIGNNIANVNTTAFKYSRTLFSSQISQLLAAGTAAQGFIGGINPKQVGLGAQVASITADFGQGALESTGIVSDLAVDGEGFFILQDETGTPVYTRDGAFRRSASNDLVNPGTGYILQGWMANADFEINPGGELSNIQIPVGEMRIARPTSQATLVGNLNSDGDLATRGSILQSQQLVRDALGNAALGTTLLTDLRNASAPAATLLNVGDIVSVNAKKGGRALPTQEFTVLSTSTMDDFRAFMDETIGINNDPAVNASRIESMVTTAGAATALLDAAQNWIDQGAQIGQRIVMRPGTATEFATTIAGIDVTTNTITLTAGDAAKAVGDTYRIEVPPKVSAGDFTGGDGAYSFQIAGNVGTASAISEVSVLAGGNVFLTFTAPANVEAVGESAQTSFVAYDSLGTGHVISMTLSLETKGDTNTWRWYADASDDTDRDLVAGPPGTGTVTFSADGQYLSSTGNFITVDLTNTGATTPLLVAPDFTSMTQFATIESELNLREQDGFEQGVLDRFTIGADGIVTGIFTNGLTRSLGQLALARFSNDNGLTVEGENLYTIGTNSGIAQIGVAGQGGRGVVRSGVLEASNVELSREFTDLIQTQRGFQANARTITSADEMLQELINLIR